MVKEQKLIAKMVKEYIVIRNIANVATIEQMFAEKIVIEQIGKE